MLAYDVAGTDRGNDLKFTKETAAFDSDARAGLDYLAGPARCTGRLGSWASASAAIWRSAPR